MALKFLGYTYYILWFTGGIFKKKCRGSEKNKNKSVQLLFFFLVYGRKSKKKNVGGQNKKMCQNFNESFCNSNRHVYLHCSVGSHHPAQVYYNSIHTPCPYVFWA